MIIVTCPGTGRYALLEVACDELVVLEDFEATWKCLGRVEMDTNG